MQNQHLVFLVAPLQAQFQNKMTQLRVQCTLMNPRRTGPAPLLSKQWIIRSKLGFCPLSLSLFPTSSNQNVVICFFFHHQCTKMSTALYNTFWSMQVYQFFQLLGTLAYEQYSCNFSYHDDVIYCKLLQWMYSCSGKHKDWSSWNLCWKMGSKWRQCVSFSIYHTRKQLSMVMNYWWEAWMHLADCVIGFIWYPTTHRDQILSLHTSNSSPAQNDGWAA